MGDIERSKKEIVCDTVKGGWKIGYPLSFL